MEPVGLTATAIATLILTKAFEKTGEKLGEKVLEKAGKLTTQLKEKFPKVNAAIVRANERETNVEALDVGEAYLDIEVAEKIEAAAKEDFEVAKTVVELAQEAKADANDKLTQAIQSLENAIKSQPQGLTFNNFSNLADKGVFQGDMRNSTFNIWLYLPHNSGGDSGSPRNTINKQYFAKIERNNLLERLSSCSTGIFDKVIFYLEPPAGTLSSGTSSQATRAIELIKWAESSDGCGLDKLYDAYLQAIGKRNV